MSNCVGKQFATKQGAYPVSSSPVARPSYAIFATHAASASLPVSNHVRQFILSNYAIDPNSDMFFYADQPQRIYVLQNNSVHYVDLCPVCSLSTQMATPCSLPSHASELAFRDGDRLSSVPSILCASRSSSESKAVKVSSSQLQSMTGFEHGLLPKGRRKTNAYKTSLCREFSATGECVYGATCRFAHGVAELRLPQQAHSKYKTQLCNNFALYKECPYGARCQFIHRRPPELVAAMEQNDQPKVVESVDGLSQSTATCPTIDVNSHRYSKGARMRGSIRSDEIAFAESEGRRNDEQRNVAFGGSLSSFHLKEAMSSWNRPTAVLQRDDEKWKEQEAVKRESMDTHRTSKQLSPLSHACCQEPSEGTNSFGGVHYDWPFDDPKVAFSQSCFPRIDSIAGHMVHHGTSLYTTPH